MVLAVSIDIPLAQQSPAISAIPNQSINYSFSFPKPVPFTVSGLGENFLLTASSDNLAIMPSDRIFFAGTGTNRVLLLLTSTNSDEATVNVTIRASTDVSQAVTSVKVLVDGSCTAPPTISGLASQQITAGAVLSLPFTVSAGCGAPAEELELTAFSSNTNVVPVENICFLGSGSNRALRLFSVIAGRTIIGVNGSDRRGRSVTSTFQLDVRSAKTPVLLLPPRKLADGFIELTMEGSGPVYEIQTSGDLISWETVVILPKPGPVRFIDPDLPLGMKFYRAFSSSNPPIVIESSAR